ncbi:methanol O-anthraniloyltransferase-like protein [Cinnamomum micranthum f. kanehirae]|uniref:Methanol O-anthraniloyltransferase-like protein n=1 Tax=Cinnamomum micranthum f. kanehirae TaxID=337451 RepID=A0A443NU91_9MAGN|nr:methanol O-anthraniloyltransferase-like protein [Cinnamomum micranthum f. kanehirae]
MNGFQARSRTIAGGILTFSELTNLTCGGFIIGLRFNHAICDSTGAAQFMRAVIEMGLGASAPSILYPCGTESSSMPKTHLESRSVITCKYKFEKITKNKKDYRW